MHIVSDSSRFTDSGGDGRDGINVIAACAGTWKMEINSIDTPYGRADKRSQTLKMIVGAAVTTMPAIKSSMENPRL
jgi:hypothetical protein